MTLHELKADLDLSQLSSACTALLVTSGSTTTSYDVVPARKVVRWRVLVIVLKKFILLLKQNAQNGNQQRLLTHPLAPPQYVPVPRNTDAHVIEVSESVLRGASGTDVPLALSNDHHGQIHVDIPGEAETSIGTTTTTTTTSTAATAVDTTTTDAIQQLTHIVRIVNTEDFDSLNQFGGVKGIAEALNTDLEAGISGDQKDITWRKSQSDLDLPTTGQATEAQPSSDLFRILLKHCNDAAIMFLTIAAALSIGFGIKEDGAENGWYEGFFIMVGVITLVVVPTLHELWLLTRSRRDPLHLEQNLVTVYRRNIEQKVCISQLVQGDVILLKTGCLVPADGLFIRGESLVVHDGLYLTVDKEHPFLFHGSTVTHGEGRMLVTTAGTHTKFSKLMSSAAATAQTPDRIMRFPAQLDRLSKVMHMVGLIISIIILVVPFVRFMINKDFDSDSDLPKIKGSPTTNNGIVDFIERIVMKPRGIMGANLVTLLTVVMVGLEEGVPVIITITTILWRKKMLSEIASDPGLLGSVIMGSATVICTDKTPLNPTDVSMCFIGGIDEAINLAEMPKLIREALGNGIIAPLVMPSSARKEEDPLLPWANSNLGIKLDTLWRRCTVMKIKGLISNEEGSAVLMKKKNAKIENMSLHFKGPASTILGKCASYYDKNGKEEKLDGTKLEIFKKNIEKMRSQDLKPVAFACKQVDATVVENDDLMDEDGLILIAMVGLKEYTCCAKIKETLENFKAAQVKFILISEDDKSELKKIATACEILPPDGLVITGEDFRGYNEQERMEKADKICVMGNSLPSDRILLMECLKRKGDVVIALGSRIEDIPMQSQANLCVTMGTRSSKMIREIFNLEVFDGSLRSLLTVTECGRCTYHNIQKYIQLDLVTNIAGTLIASITTMWLGSNSITGIQLIWTNLVTTLVIGPALLMELPNDELMHKPPIRTNEPLISKAMCRNIIIQALYQTTILVTFQFKGHYLLHFLRIHKRQQHVSKPMIFNSFVLCQIFNQVNSRELEKINVWKGIHRNPWFSLAMVFVLGLQASFIEVAHVLVGDESLNLAQWVVCLIVGIVSCPVDAAAKCTWNLTKKLLNRFHDSASSDSVSNLEFPLMSTENSTSESEPS
ncbi:calcium-transporting ATPase 12, plasma membrane-type-like [Humulus lupulus]|uniref:calcium-transporting ATPase 12, plasma membrane-type-like n=1 Tax=Humulus lupulus TaxID=3486 RepID=UPI002B415167|nr:calcium-transporting ATPase 12, plasma membrane-type-like [Humulus lupulus]